LHRSPKNQVSIPAAFSSVFWRKHGKAEANRWIQIMHAANNEKKDIVLLVYSQAGFTNGTQQRLVDNGAYIVS